MADYENGLLEIERLNDKLSTLDFDYEKQMVLAVENCPSQLDAYDFVFSMTIGIASAILDTDDKIADFLDEVHQVSNGEAKTENPVIEYLAKVLHHEGDWMDKIPTDQINKSGTVQMKYVTRFTEKAAENTWVARDVKVSVPHRIAWGHDVFSLHGDNPFSLLIKQYGVGKGVLQAIRHIVADTCSKQGLPLPGSSYFDYLEVETSGSGNAVKRAKNKLVDFCQQYSQEALGKKQGPFDNEIFDHMFSIHTQDVLSTGLVFAAIAAYSAGRKIKDEVRKVQMRIIGYMGAAFGSAIIGAAKHDGIPTVNYPAFAALAKNVVQMIVVSNKETKQLWAETERIISEGDVLESRERAVHDELVSDLHAALASGGANEGRESLINFFREEK